MWWWVSGGGGRRAAAGGRLEGQRWWACWAMELALVKWWA
jgi:hypothetical protein